MMKGLRTEFIATWIGDLQTNNYRKCHPESINEKTRAEKRIKLIRVKSALFENKNSMLCSI